MDSWDDLRFMLAVARHGTILAASKALAVNQSTVSRRLRALEENTKTQLFEKLKHGAVLSEAGHQMVASAEQMESLWNDLDARIHGLDGRLEGTLRVTSTDNLLSLWMNDFAIFAKRYPGVTLEFTSGYSIANLTRREADVALRMGPSAPEHLIGRRHAELRYAVYGSHELVEHVGAQASYDAYPWLSWDQSISRATDDYLAKHVKGARIAARVDRMGPMMVALEAGMGITIMPCLDGDRNACLRRVGDYFEGGFYLWVLTHPDLSGSARVRAFTRFVSELTARDCELLEGREGSADSPSRSVLRT